MIKNTLLAILPLTLILSACGGGSSGSGQENTVKPPESPPSKVESSPMFTQAGSVYTFDISSSGLNNRFTHTLMNDVISQTLTNTKPSQILNRSSFGDKYFLDQNKVYIQKDILDTPINQAALTNYFISDNGATLVTSFYNTEGVNPTIRHAMSYKRYDVSGLKVKDYIYKKLLTSTTNPTSAAALNASTTLFPEGSVVFIPGEITNLDEYYEIFADYGVSYSSFNAVPNIANYPLSRTFGGVEIRYSNSTPLGYALYNGKVYQAWYYPKNYKVIFNQDNNYYYNSIAADVVSSELVNSCGTGEYTDFNTGCVF